MKFFTILDRIDKMNKLVSEKRTGTPQEFASRLGVSRTSLYELIDEFRSRDVPIAYSKSIRSFYFTRPYEIRITFLLRPLTDEEGRDISGGNYVISDFGLRFADTETVNGWSGSWF